MQPTGWLSKPSVSTMQLVSTCTSPRSNRAMRSARAAAGISPVTVSAVTPSARNAAATASACSTVAQKKMRAPVGGALLPVLDHRLVEHGPVQHLVGLAHVEVAGGAVHAGELVARRRGRW